MDVVNCIKYIHFMASDPPPFYGGRGGGAESFKRAAEKICYFRVDPKFKWGGVTFKDTMHSENSYSLYDNLYDG